MRVLAALVVLGGCSFSPGLGVGKDAPPPSDGPIPFEGLPPPDVMIDGDPGGRIPKTDLIGYWTFDDPDGSASAADTSPAANTPLVISQAAPTFSNGVLSIATPTRLASTNAHQAGDVVDTGAVTLEAWVTAGAATQGTDIAPVVIAGLSANVNSRDISLMQAGDHWVGRVRTTADKNGKPSLDSTSTASTTDMVHLVLVDDGKQTTLYVNAVSETSQVSTGIVGWEPYQVVVGNEPTGAPRAWLGQIALVAIYKHALTLTEVQQNYVAGPAAN